MTDVREGPAKEAPRLRAFDEYECDLETAEVWRGGVRVHLPQQPLRVLLALLERPGALVSREELRRRLWPADTFVDFEHGLNAAVKRLRATLGDEADRPRFVETVPQRGYRFVAPLAEASPQSPSLPAPAGGRDLSRRLGWVRGGAALVALAGLAIAFRPGSPRGPEVVSARRITHAGRVGLKVSPSGIAPMLTDGVRLYYTELEPGGASHIAQVAVTGGEAVRIPTSLARPVVLGLASDGTQLLVRDVEGEPAEGPLWALATGTGALRRLGSVVAHDAAWSPDGGRLAYATGHEIHLADAEGNRATRAAALPGRADWLRWSPDGRTLRFTLTPPGAQGRSLWELVLGRPAAQRLFGAGPAWSASCCGEWTPDGRRFVFTASSDLGNDVWTLLEDGAPPGQRPSPQRLTSGPVGFLAAIPSRDGRRLFAAGLEGRSELLKYDAQRGRLVARSGVAGAYSRDRQFVAWRQYGGPGALWRSRIDGRDRVQIAPSGMDVLMAPSWSPDGSRLAFAARQPGEPWKIHLVAADGANPHRALPGSRHEADPSWSPDGRSLMFGRPPDSLGEPGARKAIHILDLETGRVITVPGSEGLFSPRWSPDGRRVAALSLASRGLELFSFDSGRWEHVTSGPAHNPHWSADGRFVYFQAEEESYRPVYRLATSTRQVERVVSPADLDRRCSLIALDLDDAPVLQCSTGGADLYAIDWRAD